MTKIISRGRAVRDALWSEQQEVEFAKGHLMFSASNHMTRQELDELIAWEEKTLGAGSSVHQADWPGWKAIHERLGTFN